MQATPNTTMTVLVSDSVDPYSGARVNETPVHTGVPALLVERPATRPRTGAEGRAVQDPQSGTPRILRVFSARLPAGTPARAGLDGYRLQDERTGRFFTTKSVRQHGNVHVDADVILELTAVDAQDP